jgi:hypothetical protein
VVFFLLSVKIGVPGNSIFIVQDIETARIAGLLCGPNRLKKIWWMPGWK